MNGTRMLLIWFLAARPYRRARRRGLVVFVQLAFPAVRGGRSTRRRRGRFGRLDVDLSILDSKSRGEERWITIGRSGDSSTFVVVHAYIDLAGDLEVIRIISARVATKEERIQYEEGI